MLCCGFEFSIPVILTHSLRTQKKESPITGYRPVPYLGAAHYRTQNSSLSLGTPHYRIQASSLSLGTPHYHIQSSSFFSGSFSNERQVKMSLGGVSTGHHKTIKETFI